MILPERPFLGCPVAGELTRLDADIVVLGIPHGVAYAVDDEQRGLATAPAAVRAASQQFAEDLTHYDFDLGRRQFLPRNRFATRTTGKTPMRGPLRGCRRAAL